MLDSGISNWPLVFSQQYGYVQILTVRENIKVTHMFWTFITQYAIVETIDGPNKYSGASAVLSVHQPDVVGKQYSAGRMMIRNGPDSLQVGWRVS